MLPVMPVTFTLSPSMLACMAQLLITQWSPMTELRIVEPTIVVPVPIETFGPMVASLAVTPSSM